MVAKKVPAAPAGAQDVPVREDPWDERDPSILCSGRAGECDPTTSNG